MEKPHLRVVEGGSMDKQKGLSHPVIDAGVALVDSRLEANRKRAA